ncbi:MAG: hypothetical protein R3A10_17435 [Caldilineaceae bacterium]
MTTTVAESAITLRRNNAGCAARGVAKAAWPTTPWDSCFRGRAARAAGWLGPQARGPQRRRPLPVILAKPSDVPTYVEYGAADIGVCGLDTLREADAPSTSLCCCPLALSSQRLRAGRPRRYPPALRKPAA